MRPPLKEIVKTAFFLPVYPLFLCGKVLPALSPRALILYKISAFMPRIVLDDLPHARHLPPESAAAKCRQNGADFNTKER